MHQAKLEKNLEKLNDIEQQSGIKILHTIKSFNQASVLPLIASNLSGMSIGNINELSMAQKAQAQHIHLYAPAYKKEALESIIDKVSTLSFNSLSQWESLHHLSTKTSMGLRINPRLYLPIPDHCNPNLDYSRLGVEYMEFIDFFDKNSDSFKRLEGLHFHALFQSSEMGTTLLIEHILEHYQTILPQLKWINLGGGHLFTSDNFSVNNFTIAVKNFQDLYPKIQLYFEPGEAVTKGCGEFISSVLDIIHIAGVNVVILDTSTETHLLDVAIVNQRLTVQGTQSESTPYFYELSGNSCIQGDLIGEYFFKEPLALGDKVIFEDMMGYSMVKMTEFNGIEKASFILQ
jgi:carboxynorspermidine decarboxylase